MSTQRYISTSFWDDEWIMTLDPSEKLLYLYFMTNPLTNIAGVYKIAPRRVSFDTGFMPETVIHMMQKFEKAGKVYRFGEYIVLPSWPKHQKWETKKAIQDGIISCLNSLSDDMKGNLVSVGYKFDMTLLDHPPIIPPSSPHQPRYSDLNSDTDTDIDLDNNAEPKSAPKGDSPYKKIEEAYSEAFSTVLPGKEPIIDYRATRARIKTLLKTLTERQILSAIEAAKRDEWLIKSGFALLTILGNFQLNKLINGQSSLSGPALRVQSRTACLDLGDE